MTRGDVDPNVVRRHLLALDDALNRLERYKGKPLAELDQTPDAIWAVERGLQLCAQNALDIATHVAATAGRDVHDYTSSIDVLAKMGVLPTDFAKRFRGP